LAKIRFIHAISSRYQDRIPGGGASVVAPCCWRASASRQQKGLSSKSARMSAPIYDKIREKTLAGGVEGTTGTCRFFFCFVFFLCFFFFLFFYTFRSI
jgi:hypothetical protein